MRKKVVVVLFSAALSSFGVVSMPSSAQACAEIDPAIGCIGPCARPLQGSPTCPNDAGDGKGKN